MAMARIIEKLREEARMTIVPDIREFDRSEVEDFYLKHTRGFFMKGSLRDDAYNDFDSMSATKIENARRAAISAIVSFLPQIGKYEEENKRIKLDLAFGTFVDKDNGDDEQHSDGESFENKISAHFDIIHAIPITKKCNTPKGREDLSRKIESAIKKTIPLCNNNHNLFVVIYKKEKMVGDKISKRYFVDCGLYVSFPATSSVVERQFMTNHFILAHSINKDSVCLSGINVFEHKKVPEILTYKFTFSKTNYMINTKMANIYGYDTATACLWHGIFERVKRLVHGTICLIVDGSWKLSDDRSFDKSNEMDLSILISSDVEESIENNVDIFISMLDFDGITVINNRGEIKAYNQFCKPGDSKTVVLGGARRRAFEKLKNSDDSHYVGLYFQSQEGDIQFYNYKTNKLYCYFDPNIMLMANVSSGEWSESNKNVKKIIDDENKSGILSERKVVELYALVAELIKIHDGPNNFYNEREGAEKIDSFLETNPTILNKSKYVRSELISITVKCLIGNIYGYSYDAEEALLKIACKFDDVAWSFFFDKKYYYQMNLVRDLIDVSQFHRFKELLNSSSYKKVVQNIPTRYVEKIKRLSSDDLLNMYYGPLLDEDISAKRKVPTEFAEDDYEENDYTLAK